MTPARPHPFRPLALLSAFLGLALASCERGASAEDALDDFLQALIVDRSPSRAWDALSESDRRLLGREEFAKREALDTTGSAWSRFARFEVLAVALSGDTGRARVALFPPEGAAPAAQSREERFLRLVRDDGDWRIFLGLETERRRARLRERARRAAEAGEIAIARTIYDSLLRISPADSAAVADHVQALALVDAEEAAIEPGYASSILFDEVRASSSGRGVLVSARMRNAGDRPVAKVELEAVFADAGRRPLAVKLFEVSGEPTAPAGLPLTPGRSWLVRRELRDVPAGWQGPITLRPSRITFPEDR